MAKSHSNSPETASDEMEMDGGDTGASMDGAAEHASDASARDQPGGPEEADPSTFLIGAEAVRAFIDREWRRRLDYRLKKEVWTYGGNHVSVLFEYEWHDAETDRWMLTHGEERWEIAQEGLLRRVTATGKDVPIAEIDRWLLPKPLLG